MSRNIIGTVSLMNTGRAELFPHSTSGHIEYHVYDKNDNMISMGNGNPRDAGSAIEKILNNQM